MKNFTSRATKFTLLVLMLSFTFPACRWLREKKAEHHQPFKPHKEGKMKRGKNNRR